MTPAARRQVDALLATAELHQTPGLAWQQWSQAGPRLLLLHGGFGSWNHWFANIEGLREHCELWTLDLPGLGASADISAAARPADFADRVLAGLDDLWPDGAEVYLAGFSFGAMVGIRLAQRLGNRCRRFIAIGAAGWGELHVQVPLSPPPPATTGWEQSAPVHKANLRALMFSPEFSIDELAISLHAENLARARFNSRGLSRTDDFRLALASATAPVHCAWGSVDATAGGEAFLASRAALLEDTGAGFELLPGVGHWAMYEVPAAVNRILLDALAH
ncbi:MAG: alpha/beta hydrolase [Halieaceae bacterium]|jgi:pimeloyl-ACP methyl ester carboxylesterase|nr:alpha/beta hydrolase [Halieaceae bacterium]